MVKNYKSGQCQVRKTWGKQALNTANAEEKKISREEHQVSARKRCGASKLRPKKLFEKERNYKRDRNLRKT